MRLTVFLCFTRVTKYTYQLKTVCQKWKWTEEEKEEDNCVGSGWRLAIRGGLNQYNQSGRGRGDDVRPISHPVLPAVSRSHPHERGHIDNVWWYTSARSLFLTYTGARSNSFCSQNDNKLHVLSERGWTL